MAISVKRPGLVDQEARRGSKESLQAYHRRVVKAIRLYTQGIRTHLPDHALNSYLRWFSFEGEWADTWRFERPDKGFPSHFDGFHLGGFQSPPVHKNSITARSRKAVPRKQRGSNTRYKRSRRPYGEKTPQVLTKSFSFPGVKTHFAHRLPPDGDVYSYTAVTEKTFTWSQSALVRGNFKSPNAYSYSATRVYFSRGWFEDRIANGAFGMDTGIIATNNSGMPQEFTTQYSSVYNQALERLNAGSSEATSPYRSGTRGDLNLTIDVAEAHQTRRMFKDMSKVLRYVKSFGPRNIGNKWLEYTYGIKPLVSSLFGVADELVRANINNVRTFTGSYTYRPGMNDLPPLVIDGFFNEPAGARISKSGVLKESVRLKIRLDVTDPTVQLLRWGTLSPLAVAWELMPYSFVVDWAYNIGSYLRNMETASAYRNAFKDGHVSHLVIADVQSSLARVSSSGGPSPVLYSGEVSQLGFVRNFSRTVLLSYPAPRMPVLDVRLGWQRMLSGAALLRQFFH